MFFFNFLCMLSDPTNIYDQVIFKKKVQSSEFASFGNGFPWNLRGFADEGAAESSPPRFLFSHVISFSSLSSKSFLSFLSFFVFFAFTPRC